MIELKEILNYTKNLKVLYVEDDEAFAKSTMEVLEVFFNHIDLSVNGKDGLYQYNKYFKENDKYYDLVITDIFMPKLNGLELSKKIYEINDSQLIIVISAINNSDYLIEFINIGIEYFVSKPFDIDDITKVLYKSSLKIAEVKSNINNFKWSTMSSELRYKDDVIKLTKKEIKLCKLLISNVNAIVSINNILKSLWDVTDTNINVNTLNPIISRLRKKLPEQLIQSIYGVGYKIMDTNIKINN